MKTLFICFSLVILFFSEGYSQQTPDENNEIEVYNFEELQSIMSPKDDKLYVVNFWATWCKPCLEELPYFEDLQADRPDEVKVFLVSLDFPNKLEKQLKPYVQKKQIKSQVILLDDPHENDWIPKIDPSWTGALPATLIYNRSKKSFYEKSFTRDELHQAINKFKT